MSAPATEVPPTSSPNPMARRLPTDTPPERRLMAEAALMAGGALLITSSVIHLLLWSEAYRNVNPIGPILVLLGVLGILLAVVVVRLATLGLALAGAAFLAVTTVVLLLASRFEMIGFEEALAPPYTARSILVPILGMALLAGVAWMISPPGRKAKPAKVAAAEASGTDSALEPSTVVPATESGKVEPSTVGTGPDPDGVNRLRWPADRQQRMRLVSESPPAPPAVPEPQEAAVSEVAPGPVPIEEPEIGPEADLVEVPVAAPEIAPEPELVEEPVGEQEVAPEPELVEEPVVREVFASEPARDVEVAASEPAPVEAEAAVPEAATTQIELEAEPVMEADAPIEPPHEPTEELAAVLEPVPESIPEPQRSMLIREHEILERVTLALGPDDPGTLTIRGNIAGYYLAAGDVWRAADLQELVAADSARILGDAHPHTMTAQGKARQWRKMAKKKKRPKVPVG